MDTEFFITVSLIGLLLLIAAAVIGIAVYVAASTLILVFSAKFAVVMLVALMVLFALKQWLNKM